MKINKNSISFRDFTVAFTAILICLSLAACGLSENPATIPNSTKGYFRDITNIWGAVVGTSYEQATNEISMSVIADANKLSVLATFVDPTVPPYCEAEMLSIAEYQIVDHNGKTVQEGSTDPTEVVNGQTIININLDSLDSDSYTLVVTAFVAWKEKGDQPLDINGDWECDFSPYKN